MSLRNSTDEEIREAVTRAHSFQEALRILVGIRRHFNGSQNRWLRKKINELNIDISHMTHKSLKKESSKKYHSPEEHLKEVFCLNSKFVESNRRKLVISRNLIPYKCAICGNEGTWNGKPLSLTLDHINGNHLDNRLENLRFVCPNCDRQLDTYGSRNKVRYNKPVVKPRETANCPKCGKPITLGSEMCVKCRNEDRRRKVPSKEVLEQELKNFKSFVSIGKKFGVSDNAIRKWFKSYGLPYKSSEIKKLRG